MSFVSKAAGCFAVLAALAATVSPIPYAAAAETVASPSTELHQRDAIDVALDAYVVPTTLLFDVDRASRNGESQEILEFGQTYNRAVEYDRTNCFVNGMAVPSAQSQELGTQLRAIDPAGWPIAERWNWCGRDRTDGGAPQNSADAICRDHDQCLSAGVDVCECDRRFVNGLNAVKQDYSWADRAYIEAAIRLVPQAHNC